MYPGGQDPRKNPNYNRFSLLSDDLATSVQEKVQDKVKVKQNQNNPVVQHQPQVNPMVARRQQLKTAVENKLTANQFATGDNTYVRPLNARVQHAQMDVGAHLTINIADVDDYIGQVNSMNITATNVLQQTRYHVTIEEFDDVNDARNPRWHSAGNPRWRTRPQSAFGAGHVNLPSVQAAIQEANGVIAVVRQ